MKRNLEFLLMCRWSFMPPRIFFFLSASLISNFPFAIWEFASPTHKLYALLLDKFVNYLVFIPGWQWWNSISIHENKGSTCRIQQWDVDDHVTQCLNLNQYKHAAAGKLIWCSFDSDEQRLWHGNHAPSRTEHVNAEKRFEASEQKFNKHSHKHKHTHTHAVTSAGQQNSQQKEERTFWWMCLSFLHKNLDYCSFDFFFICLLFQNQRFNLLPVFVLQPERIDPSASRQGYDVRSDVWSLGITLVSRSSTQTVEPNKLTESKLN